MTLLKKAIIIGAGPAGLTAAYELLDKTDIKPLIYEKSHEIGGISKTITYKGNKIDIGGHRFFFKVRSGYELVDQYFTPTGSSGQMILRLDVKCPFPKTLRKGT
nr:NAD(P)-binding protein [Methanobacterium formicicum]